MSVDAEIRHHMSHGVARITIDRPQSRNALTTAHRSRIRDLLDDASRNLDVRVVVLTGTGTVFCAGGDLRAAPATPRPTGAPERAQGDVARMVRNAQELIGAVLDCERPVVAAVNGDAVGFGAQLALACDFLVATRGARFRQVFVQRGLVPDGGAAWLLPRLVGPHHARRLLLLGEDLDAETAAGLGIVTTVTDPEDLLAATNEIVERLATGPTRAIALTKRLLTTAQDGPRSVAFDAEAAAQEQALGTDDAQEGIAAFLERRAPRFLGW